MRVDTLTQAIERASLATTGVTFWSDPGRSDFYRYETLLNNVRAVADSLVRRGLKRRDTVAIVLGTGPDFYAAFFGVCLAGGIPTALYPPARLGKVEEWKHRTAKMLAAVECAAAHAARTRDGRSEQATAEAAHLLVRCEIKAHVTRAGRPARVLTTRDITVVAPRYYFTF